MFNNSFISAHTHTQSTTFCKHNREKKLLFLIYILYYFWVVCVKKDSSKSQLKDLQGLKSSRSSCPKPNMLLIITFCQRTKYAKAKTCNKVVILVCFWEKIIMFEKFLQMFRYSAKKENLPVNFKKQITVNLQPSNWLLPL